MNTGVPVADGQNRETSSERRQDAVAVRGAEPAAVPAAVRILPVSGESRHLHTHRLPSPCDRFKLSEKPSGGEAHNCVGFKVQLIQALFIYRVERRASAEQRAEKQRISVFEALLCVLIVTDIKLTTIAFHLNKGV